MGAWRSKPEEKKTPIKREEKVEHTWRVTSKIGWTEQDSQKKRKLIEAKATEREDLLKVLIFGPTGCGKSSLCNGLKTAITGDPIVQHYFGVGSAIGSFTKGFLGWRWKNIALVDMAGVCEDREIKNEDIENILLGDVSIKAKLSDNLEARSNVTSEKPKDPYNCVVLVLKPGMEFSEQMKRILNIASDLARKDLLAHHVVLTHLDVLEAKFSNPRHLVDVLSSDEVQKSVQNMARRLGIALNCISIVRNYVGETDSDPFSNALFLDTLHQIVASAVTEAEKRKGMTFM